MYDPFCPNDYAAVLREQEAAAAAAAPSPSSVPGSTFSLGVELVSPAAATGTLSLVAASAEDLVRERVRMSAAMGIAAAVQQEREADDARHKSHVQQGKDAKSRIRGLLMMGGGGGGGVPAPLVPEAASPMPYPLSHGGDSSWNAGSSSSGGVGIALSPIAHLEFVPSSMPAGGYQLVATSAAAAQAAAKPALTGKPSSTIVLRNLVSRGHVDPQLQADLQGECARFGVVRGLVMHELAASHPLSLADAEAVRVFVRYDSVAAAFKAGEALNGRLFDGRRVAAAFYPTLLFDGGKFEEALAAAASH